MSPEMEAQRVRDGSGLHDEATRTTGSKEKIINNRCPRITISQRLPRKNMSCINSRTHARRTHDARTACGSFTRAFLSVLSYFFLSGPICIKHRTHQCASHTNLSSRYVLHRFHALCPRGTSEKPPADEMIKHCTGRGGTAKRVGTAT